jgi:hypothetical protein
MHLGVHECDFSFGDKETQPSLGDNFSGSASIRLVDASLNIATTVIERYS